MADGILMAAFGTGTPDGRAVLADIEQRVRARFPGRPIAWAYTSGALRSRLAAQGVAAASVPEALDALRTQGCQRVAVQPLHVVAGAEFHELSRTVRGCASEAGVAARVGKPLLSTRSDLERVVAAVLADLPPLHAGDAVVVVGHGHADGCCDMAYLAAAAAFRNACPAAFLGTLRGQPTLADVLAQVRAVGPLRVLLVPFMVLVGNHVREDIAGEAAASWRSAVEQLAIECEPVLRGLAEYDGVVDVWLDHLAAVYPEEL